MRASASYLLYVLIVGLSALFISEYYLYLQTNWFLAAAWLFAVAAPFFSPLKNMLVIFAFGLLAAVLVLIVSLCLPWVVALAAILFFITLACVSYGLQYPRYFYLLLTVNGFALFAAAPVLDVDMLQRMSAVIAGVSVAALGQIIFIFKFAYWRTRFWEKRVIKSLQLICQDIFACFLRPEYADNLYFFEHRLHVSKAAYFVAIEQFVALADLKSVKYQKLFDVLIDAGQLRRRVTDFTVFSLCTQEMTLLSVELNLLFSQLEVAAKKKHFVIDTYRLEERINLFTSHFQTVLNVAAREPLAFLLFIASLQHFSHEVQKHD